MNATTIEVDLSVYSLDVVLRTCHAFTARCYVFVRRTTPSTATIDFAARDERESIRDLTGSFGNALLDQQLRANIAAETRAIRELLVAQAFSEADLLDRRQTNAGEYEDPRGIV